jgi:SAM-dependent methyltransferase
VAELGENVFDLVHGRFVFIHIREREKALANVLRSLKPEGRLLLEEPNFGAAGPSWEEGTGAGVIARIYEATRQMYLATGGDPFLGRRLAGWLQGRGLDIQGSEASSALWRGGSPRGRLRRLAVEHLWPRLLATGAVSEDDLQVFLKVAEEPAVWAFDYTTVAVWGCKRDER